MNVHYGSERWGCNPPPGSATDVASCRDCGVSRHITIMCHKKTIFKRNTRALCIWTSILYIFIAMHSCIHIALHVQEEAILVLNHLNDTVYEVFNISYHKVTDYLNTHNEIILNNIKD